MPPGLAAVPDCRTACPRRRRARRRVIQLHRRQLRQGRVRRQQRRGGGVGLAGFQPSPCATAENGATAVRRKCGQVGAAAHARARDPRPACGHKCPSNNAPAAQASACRRASSSSAWMVMLRDARSTSMPWRASWYSGWPSRFSAEYIGGTWLIGPWKAGNRAATSPRQIGGHRLRVPRSRLRGHRLLVRSPSRMVNSYSLSPSSR